MPKPAKATNNDFCPHCGKTFPRDQRDYHLMDHYRSMHEEILGALASVREELAKLGEGRSQGP